MKEVTYSKGDVTKCGYCTSGCETCNSYPEVDTGYLIVASHCYGAKSHLFNSGAARENQYNRLECEFCNYSTRTFFGIGDDMLKAIDEANNALEAGKEL